MKYDFKNNVLTVYLSGEIDHHGARKIREETDSLIQQNKPVLLNMDFSDVGFSDSSGIGLIMGRYRLMSLYGGKTKVINIPERLRYVMNLSGLSSLHITDK